MREQTHGDTARGRSAAGPTSPAEVPAGRAQTSAVADRPIILVVSDHRHVRDALTAGLSRRYAADYDVRSQRGPAAAVAELEQLRDKTAEVALIVADQSMTAEPGTAFLARARDVYPSARRLLVTAWPGLSSLQQVAKASTLGEIDHHTTLPPGGIDEPFLSLTGDVIADWARERGRRAAGIRVIADQADPDAQALAAIFEGWVGTPVGWLQPGSAEARQANAAPTSAPQPVAILPDGRAIARPSVAEVIRALGENAEPLSPAYDVAVIGAGPAGLSAALNAASEGLSVVLVEPSVGQASSSPMIRNYLGFPAGISGAELVRRAWWQASMFGVRTLGGRAALGIRSDGEDRFVVLDDGSEIQARAVVLGMGASYRRIGVPSVEALVGRGVFYGSGATEARALAGEPVAVVGGGNSAAQAAVHLARYASRVDLLVRGPSLADTASRYLTDQLDDLGNVEVRVRSQVIEARDRHRLRSLVIRDNAAGSVSERPATALFLLIGAEPRTDWLPAEIERDERGFILTGDATPSHGDGGDDDLPLETTMPGVFAVGDVRHGSVKRVAPAVGEGAATSQQLLRYFAEQPALHRIPAGRR
jgi:thioredoxin reductase (NADPH)